MSRWNQVFLLLLVVGCVAAYFLIAQKPRRRVLPPPRTTKPAPSFHETDSLAKLFVAVVNLKERAATWPSILQELNSENDPHIRTLLLELREQSTSDPGRALVAIEQACIATKNDGRSLNQAELLEVALSALRMASLK